MSELKKAILNSRISSPALLVVLSGFYVWFFCFRGRLSFDSLRKVCRLARKFNSHFFYERFLALYDPALRFNFRPSCFVGAGKGRNVVNSYRLCSSGSVNLFEKIYVLGSYELDRIDSFYKKSLASGFVDSYSRAGVYFPGLFGEMVGSRLSIKYFIFIDGIKSPSVDFCLVKMIDVVEACIRDGAFFFLGGGQGRSCGLLYEGCRELVLSDPYWASRLSADFEEVEAVVLKSSPYALSHGDMHVGNFSENGYLFDLDACGLYPMVTDLATISTRSGCFESIDQIDHFLEASVLPRLDKCRAEFRRSFIFMYFVLLFGSKHRNRRLEVELWEHILVSGRR